MHMRHLKAFTVGIVVALATASVAAAQAPYLGNGGEVQGEVGGQVSASGSLPFTGFDLGALLVGGVLLLALGFVLRRHGRERTKALS